MDNQSDQKRPHKVKQAGRKATKKKQKNVSQTASTKQQNPKAFAFQSIVKARKNFIRSQDIQSKKHHIPVIDRTPLEPPPVVVAVAGGPQVGKTTLIRGLIKNYTRQKLSTINGPVTIVAGKKKRLTFIEVNNDINCMVDIAKVADVVLLIIDATLGIEMEIFEFLEICRAHGSPRIMGILNHLDMVKDNKALRKKKKVLKHRFQVELYPGAKLFYLSGIIHGEYLKSEVSNLGRFISVMKFRPLTFRSSHSYVVVDRWEDITNSETVRKDQKRDRNVVLYGYVRGVPLKNAQWIHIPGCGDFCLKNVSILPDPCPLPEQLKKRSLNAKERLLYGPMSVVAGVVYDKDAVYIDLGGSHHGREKGEIFQNEEEKASKTILEPLLDLQKTTDEKREESDFKLFSNASLNPDREGYEEFPLSEESQSDATHSSAEEQDEVESDIEEDHEEVCTPPRKKLKSQDLKNDDQMCDQASSSQRSMHSSRTQKDIQVLQKLDHLLQRFKHPNEQPSMSKAGQDSGISDGEESSNYDDEEEELTGDVTESAQDQAIETSQSREDDFRLGILMDATRKFHNNQSTVSFLNKYIYGDGSSNFLLNYGKSEAIGEKENFSSNPPDDEDDSDDLFTRSNERRISLPKNPGKTIFSRDLLGGEDSSRYNPPKLRDWTLDENKTLIANCFVTGEWSEKEDAENLLKMDDEDEDLDADSKDENEPSDDEKVSQMENSAEEKEVRKKKKDKTAAERRLDKKRRLKVMFDSEYDDKGKGDDFEIIKAQMNQQAQLNQLTFENMDEETRVQYEGFRAGLYVRMELDKMPCEFVQNFDPNYPVVIGGLSDGEQAMGFLRLRFKVHRWYPKILKNRDPLILSLGWRRFQTQMYYAKREDDFRLRSLKYARKYLHIEAVGFAPISAVSSGFVAFQNISDRVPEFRIAANGVVLGNDQSVNITKKLKLIGYPEEIHTKTAFIKDMFHSDVEVVKFEGTKIQTQSGIRGIIKRPKGTEGLFRATFEDVIKKSDTVILKTWAQMDVSKFYSCVRTLLLPANEKVSWRGMRTVSQIKKEEKLRSLPNPDSFYTPITERREYYPLPLKIPKKLQNALPYKFKPKVVPRAKAPARVVMVKDPHEVKMDEFMMRLKAMMVDKKTKERKEKRLHHKKYKKQILEKALQREKREKKVKSETCKLKSQRNKNKTM